MPIIQLLPSSQDTFNKALTVNGDGTGNADMAGLYSPASPGVFFIKPPRNKSYVITSLLWTLTDVGGFRHDGYASKITPLDNGVKYERTLLGEQLATILFKQNDEFSEYSTGFDLVKYDVSGSSLRVSYDFNRLCKYATVLYGMHNDYIRVTIQDDLSFMYRQTVTVQGYSL